jgi:hypothetical protein
MKIKVTKDYIGKKSVMAVALSSGMSIPPQPCCEGARMK